MHRFLFDLNSTHGTKLNKNSIKKRSYIPLHAGYVFRIAGLKKIFYLKLIIKTFSSNFLTISGKKPCFDAIQYIWAHKKYKKFKITKFRFFKYFMYLLSVKEVLDSFPFVEGQLMKKIV